MLKRRNTRVYSQWRDDGFSKTFIWNKNIEYEPKKKLDESEDAVDRKKKKYCIENCKCVHELV